MASAAVTLILEKIGSKDKDFRYMATSDLLAELQKESFKIDPELERKLCQVILNQLEDQSGDISALAVKCLGCYVRKVGEGHNEEMVAALCDKVITGKKEQQRDIASIGLKTVVDKVLPGPGAAKAANLITVKMMGGLQHKDNFEVLNDSLDILADVLTKFGQMVSSEHPKLRDVLLVFLDDHRALIRKRAMHALGALSVHLSNDLLTSTIQTLLATLCKPQLKADTARTYVQTLGLVTKSVGYRFGKYLSEAVPLLVRHCREASEGDDEMREYCLQGLESFVLRCPDDARQHVGEILGVALTFLKYDPNFDDDMDEDDVEGGDEDDEDGESEEEYSDDEDVSWKVRRAAAKCVCAIIQHYPHQIADIYQRCSGELVARLREREENVKMDVFHAYVALLREVGQVSRNYRPEDPANPLQLLRADVNGIVKATTKQLGGKSLKAKAGVFLVLKELVMTVPGAISDHIPSIVPGVISALQDKTSNSSTLKIEALAFLRLALRNTPPSVFQPHVPRLSTGIVAAIGERYYKVAAEALRVCEEMILVVRPDPTQPLSPELSRVVKPIFDCVLKRLSAQDQDQEVKECAILCMATVVATLGDILGGEIPAVLRLLLDRLRNEITRVSAVKAFSVIASSPLPQDLGPVISQVLQEATSFMRKANRLLRQASLQALEGLARKYGDCFDPVLAAASVEEAAALIQDSDLALTAASLQYVCTLLGQQMKTMPSVVLDKVLPSAFMLVRSPLLQGPALEAVQSFFCVIVNSGSPQTAFPTLLSSLLEAGKAASGKQAQLSAALCIARLCTDMGKDKVAETVQKLLGMLQAKNDVGSQRLALLCLGEMGRRADLAMMPQVETAITSALQSDSDEVKSAASLALGGVTCGNLAHFMPALLEHIRKAQSDAKQQYLLLQALDEVITTLTKGGQSAQGLSPAHQSQALQLLLDSCEGEEECRNMVAECLGQLVLLYPTEVLGELRTRLGVPSASVRCTVVSAVRYCVTDRPHPADEQLQACLPDFLAMMKDQDRHVRKAAVGVLSAFAHHKPSLVAHHVPSLLPDVYDQTLVKSNMIRTVDLGPFKHKIDDGLELRKASFEGLDILLDSCPDRLSYPDLLQYLVSGLGDHYDVKITAHLILTKLCAISSPAVLGALDRLVEPLEKTLTAKLKSDAVKQEQDRNEDLLRSCLRAVVAVSHMSGVENCGPFQQFMKRTVLVGAMQDKFHQVEKEKVEAEGGDSTNGV